MDRQEGICKNGRETPRRNDELLPEKKVCREKERSRENSGVFQEKTKVSRYPIFFSEQSFRRSLKTRKLKKLKLLKRRRAFDPVPLHCQ